MKSRGIEYTKGDEYAEDSLWKSELFPSTIKSCLRLCRRYHEYLENNNNLVVKASCSYGNIKVKDGCGSKLSSQRKYPEQVESEMYRVMNGNDIFLLRKSANFVLGEPLHTATIFMTNPGSFKLKNIAGWDDFQNGQGTSNVFSGEDYPDMTMQNVIEVIRGGYSKKGAPCCRVEIINISNIVNPKGTCAEDDHNKVKLLLGANKALLQTNIVTNQEDFQEKCRQSDFIIMGFVKEVFTKEVMQLMNWVKPFQNKLVVASDDDDWYSHPRRWRTEPKLKEKAQNRLQKIISVHC